MAYTLVSTEMYKVNMKTYQIRNKEIPGIDLNYKKMECKDCIIKPGSPVLCATCLALRELSEKYNILLEVLADKEEQYKCKSYYNDYNVLVDCTCGKCKEEKCRHPNDGDCTNCNPSAKSPKQHIKDGVEDIIAETSV